MHLATIIAPILAPLAVWALSRSPFVIAHARRSLAETLVIQALVLVAIIVSLSYSILSLYGHYQTDWKDFSIWPIFARAAVGWIILSLLEIANMISAFRHALRAYSGSSA